MQGVIERYELLNISRNTPKIVKLKKKKSIKYFLPNQSSDVKIGDILASQKLQVKTSLKFQMLFQFPLHYIKDTYSIEKKKQETIVKIICNRSNISINKPRLQK